MRNPQIVMQDLDFGWVSLEAAQAVLRAHQLQRQPGRARIPTGQPPRGLSSPSGRRPTFACSSFGSHSVTGCIPPTSCTGRLPSLSGTLAGGLLLLGVEARHLVTIVGQQRRQLPGLPQRLDTTAKFGVLACLGSIQPIAPRTGVRVEDPERLVLQGQVAQDGHQDGVLEHIGMVADMKGVAITEHGRGDPERDDESSSAPNDRTGVTARLRASRWFARACDGRPPHRRAVPRSGGGPRPGAMP